MKERPILFSGPMIRALLAGRKTQTRRVLKVQPKARPFQVQGDASGDWFTANPAYPRHGAMMNGRWHCPYGQTGDRLWVRETFECIHYLYPEVPIDERADSIIYRAEDNGGIEDLSEVTWRPSIFMPRWASRLTLEIVSVRVERLHEISREDAVAEGIERHTKHGTEWYSFYPIDADYPGSTTDARQSYCSLWDSINGDGAWSSNPWVWVVEFKRVEQQPTPTTDR